MPEAKTIKQAKAAYKARSEQPLTEREQKQLDRAIQLDRRAWGIREREKNKLDLAKKRAAQEKAQKEEERRIGTQRRNDKFGFKSSQYHLGAFFRKPGAVPLPGLMETTIDVAESHFGRLQPGAEDKAAGPLPEHKSESEDDEFEDVDDETLLEALQSPEVARASKTQSGVLAKPDFSMPPPPRPAFLQANNAALGHPSARIEDDFEWNDFLESSTQVAREIGTETPTAYERAAYVPGKESLRKGSFSSGSFELTEDDIEQLDPTPCARTEDNPGVESSKAIEERTKMPPPPIPTKNHEQGRLVDGPSSNSSSTHFVKPIQKPDDLGFNLSQLEDFVEDDLQLTQAG